LETLLGASGIANETTIVLYGDNNNWFAAYAFWQLKYYGHKDVRLMNGGRKKWIEEGRTLTTQPPAVTPTKYSAAAPDESIRARKEDIFAILEKKRRGGLVDVRSVEEFIGKILAPPGLAELAMRAGRIPGAANVPWSQAVNADGTFKSREALESLYLGKGFSADEEIIAYCRIGERSSHTWFVLKYLLGIDKVKNYDGSWTEWGNLVGAPIENETAVRALSVQAKMRNIVCTSS
jgi:thiosulfate/3-mercaptopyruvate sulfurtransferase